MENKFEIVRVGQESPQGWVTLLTNFYVVVYAPWCKETHTKYFTDDKDRAQWIKLYCKN